jgi:5-methylcytosine-specific restriction endonuclease McrA
MSDPVSLTAAPKLSKVKTRLIILKKYGGKCAYCGVDLAKGWNVDHITPQVFGGTNDLENLNPSCRDCNNYKCHTDLEGYRRQLRKMLNEKLNYLFKSKTKMQVAMNMGSIKHAAWDGMFYFERESASEPKSHDV